MSLSRPASQREISSHLRQGEFTVPAGGRFQVGSSNPISRLPFNREFLKRVRSLPTYQERQKPFLATLKASFEGSETQYGHWKKRHAKVKEYDAFSKDFYQTLSSEGKDAFNKVREAYANGELDKEGVEWFFKLYNDTVRLPRSFAWEKPSITPPPEKNAGVLPFINLLTGLLGGLAPSHSSNSSASQINLHQASHHTGEAFSKINVHHSHNSHRSRHRREKPEPTSTLVVETTSKPAPKIELEEGLEREIIELADNIKAFNLLMCDEAKLASRDHHEIHETGKALIERYDHLVAKLPKEVMEDIVYNPKKYALSNPQELLGLPQANWDSSNAHIRLSESEFNTLVDSRLGSLSRSNFKNARERLDHALQRGHDCTNPQNSFLSFKTIGEAALSDPEHPELFDQGIDGMLDLMAPAFAPFFFTRMLGDHKGHNNEFLKGLDGSRCLLEDGSQKEGATKRHQCRPIYQDHVQATAQAATQFLQTANGRQVYVQLDKQAIAQTKILADKLGLLYNKNLSAQLRDCARNVKPCKVKNWKLSLNKNAQRALVKDLEHTNKYLTALLLFDKFSIRVNIQKNWEKLGYSSQERDDLISILDKIYDDVKFFVPMREDDLKRNHAGALLKRDIEQAAFLLDHHQKLQGTARALMRRGLDATHARRLLEDLAVPTE